MDRWKLQNKKKDQIFFNTILKAKEGIKKSKSWNK